MIVGFSHLTEYYSPIQEGCEMWKQIGFSLKFLEKVENHPEKRPFLRKWVDAHQLAFMQKLGDLSVELVDYGSTPKKAPRSYQREKEGGQWTSTFQLLTSDVAATQQFWMEGLGLEHIERKTPELEVQHLRHRGKSLWTAIDLKIYGSKEVDSGFPMYMDDPGINCLSFVTTDMEEDFRNLERQGGTEISGSFQLQLGGKRMNVGLVRSPTKEIVELLQFMV